MPLIYNHPPKLFWLLKLFFPAIDPNYTIVTFGDRIYSVQDLPAHLIEHEKTHMRQHHYSKIFAVGWWYVYLLNPRFRLSQEVEAYRAQWDFVVATVPAWTEKGQLEKAQILAWMATDLSGPMYGDLVTYDEAVALITQKHADNQSQSNPSSKTLPL